MVNEAILVQGVSRLQHGSSRMRSLPLDSLAFRPNADTGQTARETEQERERERKELELERRRVVAETKDCCFS